MNVIYLSCAAYSDLWPVVVPRIAWALQEASPTITIVTDAPPPQPTVAGAPVIAGGSRTLDFSTNLLRALEHVDAESFLLWLDDLYPLRQVPGSQLADLDRVFEQRGLDYLRLRPNPPARTGERVREDISLTRRGERYRNSLHVAMWRKKALSELLVAGENPWEFEKNGCERIRDSQRFAVCDRPVLHYANLVIKGRVSRLALWQIRKAAGPRVELPRRKMSLVAECTYRSKQVLIMTGRALQG